MTDWPGGTIPPGYKLVETDERVAIIGSRLTRRGAERLAAGHRPFVPSYHLRIERQRFGRWNVVAYQNRLRPPPRDPGVTSR